MERSEKTFSHGAGEPEAFYAHVIITVLDHAPLLAVPRLARCVVGVMDACAEDAPGHLWGYLVLPDTLRLVVGPVRDDALDRFIDLVKACSSARLLDAIRRADDDSLDMVLRYNPVWGGAIYQVWHTGYHRQVFWTEYKLSNVLYDLRWLPVVAGLVISPDQWPYGRVGDSLA